MTKPKTWLECTREEKVQRMIENAECAAESARDEESEIALLEMSIQASKEDEIRFRKQARLIAVGETEDPARP